MKSHLAGLERQAYFVQSFARRDFVNGDTPVRLDDCDPRALFVQVEHASVVADRLQTLDDNARFSEIGQVPDGNSIRSLPVDGNQVFSIAREAEIIKVFPGYLSQQPVIGNTINAQDPSLVWMIDNTRIAGEFRIRFDVPAIDALPAFDSASHTRPSTSHPYP